MKPFAYRLSRRHQNRDLSEILYPASVEQAIQWAMYYDWPPEETNLTTHTGSPIAYKIDIWKGDNGESFPSLLQAAYAKQDEVGG